MFMGKKTPYIYTLILILGFAFFFCGETNTARAELAQTDVSIESVPEIPGPYENVTLTLISYAVDLNRLQITWFENGVSKLSGVGKKQYSFTTSGIGTVTTIEAKIVSGGAVLSKRFVIRPASVDMLWEATDTYIPPFYRGKALPSSEGVIKVVAFPHFKNGSGETASSAVVYNWKRNYNSVTDSSGYGKNVFLFKQSYLNPIEQIGLTAIDNGTGSSVKKTVYIKTYSPKIIFYEKDPLLGIKYEKAFNEIDVTDAEKSIIAEPYFFSPGNIFSSDLDFVWKINSSIVETPLVRNAITLKSGGEGVSNITLEIKNKKRIFVNSKGSLKINLLK